MASPTSRTQVTYLVTVAIVAIVALVTGLALGPNVSEPGPTSPAASPIAQATPEPTPRPSPLRPPGPNEYPPSLSSGPCEPPETLPRPREPDAAPVVHTDDAAVLFSSFLYRRTADGKLKVQYQRFQNFEIGLWYAPPGTHGEARLLAETDRGAVAPLALAPQGDVAAVWWLPDQRWPPEDDCISGIYLLSLATGDSRLIATGAWWHGGADADEGPVVMDEYVAARDYRPPRVSFSSDGRFVALAQHTRIAIYRVASAKIKASHVGACQDWAWSSTGATFVAGCERMTSAWVVHLRRDLERSVALPSPVPLTSRRALTEIPGSATIGVTLHGKVRAVRFYGSPSGCDSPGCAPPGPAYTVTTVDPETTTATTNLVETDFFTRAHTRLSPDARWIYAPDMSGQIPARLIDTPRGDVDVVRRFGRVIGASAADSVLFGRRKDRPSWRVLVTTLSRSGGTGVIATISWAVGSRPRSPDRVIPTWGLVVATPAE